MNFNVLHQAALGRRLYEVPDLTLGAEVDDLPSHLGDPPEHRHLSAQPLRVRLDKGIVHDEEPLLPLQDLLAEGQADGEIQLVVGAAGELFRLQHLAVPAPYLDTPPFLVEEDRIVEAVRDLAEIARHRVIRAEELGDLFLLLGLYVLKDVHDLEDGVPGVFGAVDECAQRVSDGL